MRRAVVAVINDLVTDQRVHKSCLALQKCGYAVVLVGRQLRNSPEMPPRPYSTVRMRLLFEKGPLFYAEFNTRLFLWLLFSRFQLLVSNDLDTLLPVFLLSRLRRIPMVFDSHEYFTETPELVHRPAVQRVWKSIERFVLSRIDRMITVNDSIAGLFEKEYGIKTYVIRNIPPRWQPDRQKSRSELGLPEDRPLLILQGSGINIQRGAEELVETMKQLNEFTLIIIGGGDVIEHLKVLARKYGAEERIIFLPRMPYDQMMHFTAAADLGFTLDKDTNLNYRLSLPNKLFDYIQAGTPVVASNLPEVSNIVLSYVVGCIAESHSPDYLASLIRNALNDKASLEEWVKNCSFAAAELCWENEEQKLLSIYESVHG
jgi:glycosyltransferase involved in cell wall biosynthesis